MLVVPMYHRVIETPFTQQPNAFENHLTYLAKHYPIIAPGDSITPRQINLCLTFDDAYFDFYQAVFPLLKKLNIRAVLAIPAGLILDDTTLDQQTRLQVPYYQAIDQHDTHATLCTWREINEMVASGHVIPASHGLTHQPLTKIGLDLEKEVVYSKKLLQDKTQTAVESFIYPYGAMNRSINQFVNQHYPYPMRIGSTLNFSWKNLHNVIYRINAEEFWPQEKPFLTLPYQLKIGLNFLSTSFRFK